MAHGEVVGSGPAGLAGGTSGVTAEGGRLGPLWLGTFAASGALLVLAGCAPWWTGHDFAALLAGGPALLLAVLAIAGRAETRRRVCMVLATATSGILALATVGGALGAGAPSGPAGGAGAYQLACLGVALAHLVLSRPCWNRANADGDAARAMARLFDEL